jgi:hypothetical protein
MRMVSRLEQVLSPRPNLRAVFGAARQVRIQQARRGNHVNDGQRIRRPGRHRTPLPHGLVRRIAEIRRNEDAHG